jgi:hypothetical protein
LYLLLLRLRFGARGTAAHWPPLIALVLARLRVVITGLIGALQIASQPVRVLSKNTACVEGERSQDGNTENQPPQTIFSLPYSAGHARWYILFILIQNLDTSTQTGNRLGASAARFCHSLDHIGVIGI